MEPSTTPETKEYLVIVIDDDELTRTMYQNRFEMEPNLRVVTASDGLEGWEKIQTLKPDVVFTGISMPRMDGFQLAEEMKKVPEFKDTPIMMSSHLGRQEDKYRAHELSIDHFFVRGATSPNEVVNILLSVLKQPNSSHIVRIDPKDHDYIGFINSNFDRPLCEGCLQSDMLPVEIKCVQNHPEKLYTIKLRCDLCKP